MFQSFQYWWNVKKLRGNNLAERRVAAQFLSEFQDAVAVKPLASEFKAKDKIVSAALHRALGRFGSKAVDTLIQGLKELDEDDLRDAVKFLIRSCDKYLRRDICSRLIEEKFRNRYSYSRDPIYKLLELGLSTAESIQFDEPWHQDNILELAISGDEKAIALLMLNKNSLSHKQLVGDKKAVALLILSKNSLIRKKLVEELAELQEPVWQTWIKGDCTDFKRLAEADDPIVFDMLLTALNVKDVDTLAMAAQILGMSQNHEAVDALVRTLENSHDDKVLIEAAAALGNLGDRRAVWSLEQAFRSHIVREKQLVSYAIAVALASLSAVDTLTEFYRPSRDSYYKWLVITALRKTGLKEAVKPLVEMLGDHYAPARKAAAKALACLGEPDWQKLVKGTDDDFLELAKSGKPEALLPLMNAVVSKLNVPYTDWHPSDGSSPHGRGPINRCAREKAATALGLFGDPRAFYALKQTPIPKGFVEVDSKIFLEARTALRITCPNQDCRKLLRIIEEWDEKKEVCCPHCNHRFVFPEPPDGIWRRGGNAVY